MSKLRERELVNENKYLKRNFGEPLPTFKGVMEQHQVNKLQEDWWDNMSPEDQAEYIQAHPGSDKAQASKENGAGEEKPTGPSMAYGAEWGDDPQASPGYTRRTGDELDDDELNQETLTINGKQFRRISEGVEKQPKPKHAFSEFYQRFKR